MPGAARRKPSGNLAGDGFDAGRTLSTSTASTDGATCPTTHPPPRRWGSIRARWNYLTPLDKIFGSLKYSDYRGRGLLPFVRRLLAGGAELNQDADTPASGSLWRRFGGGTVRVPCEGFGSSRGAPASHAIKAGWLNLHSHPTFRHGTRPKPARRRSVTGCTPNSAAASSMNRTSAALIAGPH